MVEILKQAENSPIWFEYQSVIIYLAINGFIDAIDVEYIHNFEKSVYEKLDSSYSWLRDAIVKEKKLTDAIEQDIIKLAQEVSSEYASLSAAV